MPQYVDGFVFPLSKKKVAAFKKIAAKGRKIWLEHGALDYRECVLEDSKVAPCLPFAKGIQAKAGETIGFSYITYKSRKHRDAANKKVMADPRMNMDSIEMPFDHTRMLYGGFTTLIGK